jgi:hypothetical protein
MTSSTADMPRTLSAAPARRWQSTSRRVQPRQRPGRAGARRDAAGAYEQALAGVETDAWRNLGDVLRELGDLGGEVRAYREAASAGDTNGMLELAFRLREDGEREEVMAVAQDAADAGSVVGRSGRGVLGVVFPNALLAAGPAMRRPSACGIATACLSGPESRYRGVSQRSVTGHRSPIGLPNGKGGSSSRRLSHCRGRWPGTHVC